MTGSPSIGKSDLVVEIGPGKGIITQELLSVSRKVQAVELDGQLFNYLKQRFFSVSNLELIHQDFLTWSLPQTPFKVFANPPFAIEGKLIRKLLDAENPPEDSYLVVRKDVAERWAGISYRSQFAVSHYPWFKFAIIHKFKRQDFVPKTRVATVMLRVTKRNKPLLPWRQCRDYQQFIAKQFQLKYRPSTLLTLTQWIQLYRKNSSDISVYQN